ncbi:hypothetical protein DXG01_001318 [Tephrocybe rancida]|nr:hypothetical protein DXG01_001318 [Tephrocybe rancida]
MSSKKAHEFHRMVSFISSLALPKHTRIGDVGAGQAYLTKALHDLLDSPALELDSDLGQTRAALRRGGPKITGIAHKTIHVDPETLVKTVNEWAPSAPAPTPPCMQLPHAQHTSRRAVPPKRTTLVSRCDPRGLSAVPDFPFCVFPAPLDSSNTSPSSPGPKIPNIQRRPQGTSKTKHTPTQPYPRTPPSPRVSPPSTSSPVSSDLSWRAPPRRLFLASPFKVTQTGSTPAMRRLGRLNDAAYQSWGAFLGAAEGRIGVDLSSVAFPPLSSPSSAANPHPFNTPQLPREGPTPPEPEYPHDHSAKDDPTTSPHPALAPRLASLHLLRCLLGPVLDRVEWLRAEIFSLAEDKALRGYGVDYVNLFDQATGSGRNVAIVVLPGAA